MQGSLYLGRTQFGSLNAAVSRRGVSPSLPDWDAAAGMTRSSSGYVISAPLPAPSGFASLTFANPAPSGLPMASSLQSGGSYTPGEVELQRLGAASRQLQPEGEFSMWGGLHPVAPTTASMAAMSCLVTCFCRRDC
jgi:hypothetical protein